MVGPIGPAALVGLDSFAPKSFVAAKSRTHSHMKDPLNKMQVECNAPLKRVAILHAADAAAAAGESLTGNAAIAAADLEMETAHKMEAARVQKAAFRQVTLMRLKEKARERRRRRRRRVRHRLDEISVYRRQAHPACQAGRCRCRRRAARRRRRRSCRRSSRSCAPVSPSRPSARASSCSPRARWRR